MRDLDLIIILTQTDGEYDDEVKQGTEALYARNVGKATKVVKVGFTQSLVVEKALDLEGLPESPKVGIYVVGHAFSDFVSGGAAFQGINAKQFADYVAKLVPDTEPKPQLMKVVLLGCSMAGGAEAEASKVTEEHGSYVQSFCKRLAAHALEPKVAGWDSYISIVRNDKSPFYGRKRMQSGKNTPVDDSFRETHKFFYQCQEGSVAKLTLAQWSDKPATASDTE